MNSFPLPRSLHPRGEYYIEDISLTDVHIKYAGGGTTAQAGKRDVPKLAAEYFGVWDTAPGGPPAYGMYARNVKRLSMQNVRFEYDQPDARPAIIFDNVQDASMMNISAKGNAGSELFRFINTKDVLITAARVLEVAKTFLKVEGAASEGIIINGTDLRKAELPVSYEQGAKKESVILRG